MKFSHYVKDTKQLQLQMQQRNGKISNGNGGTKKKNNIFLGGNNFSEQVKKGDKQMNVN